MKKLLSLIALVTCLSASGQIVSLTGVDPVQVTMPATGTRTVAFRKSLTDSMRTAFSQIAVLQKTVSDQSRQISQLAADTSLKSSQIRQLQASIQILNFNATDFVIVAGKISLSDDLKNQLLALNAWKKSIVDFFNQFPK